MSDYRTNATVTLNVNGKQAQDILSDLKQRAAQLETAMAKAAAAGNKTDLTKARKELKQVERQIQQIERASDGAERVMRRLDTASPKELYRTLKQLQGSLNGIERGSEQWNRQTAAIRRVKAEIDKVNAAQREGLSLGERMHNTFAKWQTEILGAVAALTGLIMAGRNAVNAYADLDQEMANVMKFTSLSRDKVEELVAMARQLDSRTSLIDLLKHAEDAGKLGMKSLEDIMGYVRGADQIMVALSDIGDGATVALSKLSSIFGIEDQLGTEKALIAIGSTITELSQNCTASSAYLANFAKRMGGVGKAAGMTIQQLIAIGAVLDANGQAAEMSATAVGKLIMDAYKDSDRFAKALKLDAEMFRKVMKEDANKGLLMIIQRFKELGDMSVLAPVFKDMGENGARASQVMATLANNIDMLRWEQQEADKAFDAATKVGKMYEIQNSTVQAGLEKARKRIKELSTELGEKLMPVMSHCMRSSTFMLKTLSRLVDFFIKYKGEIAVTTVSIVAYYTAAHIAAIKTAALTTASAVGKVAMAAYTAAMRLGAAAIALFQGNITKARREFILFSAALKANPIGLLVAGITAAIGALVLLATKTRDASRAQQDLEDIELQAAKSVETEKIKIEALTKRIHDNSLSLKDRQAAIEALQKIVPDYTAKISKEGEVYGENTDALKKYIEQLKTLALVEGAKAKLEELGKERAELVGKLAKQKRESERRKGWKESSSSVSTAPGGGGAVLGFAIAQSMSENKEVDYERQIKDLDQSVKDITTKYGPEMFGAESNPQPTTTGDTGDTDDNPPDDDDDDDGKGGKGGKAADRFAEEKAWKEREEALNRIAYAKGEKDYDEYTKRMDEIAVEFYGKILQRQDLTEQERLSNEAEFYEAKQKQQDTLSKLSAQQEEDNYAGLLAKERQRYIDGEADLDTHNKALQLLELEHLRKMAQLYGEGTKERRQAETAYQNKLIEDRKKRQKEAEEAEKKHQSELKKIKDEFFGNNAAENRALYLSALAGLDEVYQQELAAAGDNAKEKLRIEEAYQKAKLALAIKYGQKEAGGMQKMTQDIVQWMESDGGKAILKSFEVLSSGMGELFSQVSDIVEAELEVQTAAIEDRYDKEISAAEGNTYKVKRLEEQKERDIAEAKNEANRKMFAMQVIQAVAQTATNAINAYGSAAAIPMVGHILAPVAASMAIAAGMLQVAAIKKQQQASLAQGYSEGGFTKAGRKDEVAGVVHAGEWVASQKLLASPVARPMIEALDYAQRTNTIGSLRSEDVSRSITAPQALAQSMADGSMQQSMLATASAVAASAHAVRDLRQRLSEPFVTINTVTGDKGIKKAQDEYTQLIRNKTPKSKRS